MKFLAIVRNSVATAVLGAALVGSFALTAKADSPAVSFTAPFTFWAPDPNYSLGWSFTANNNVDVTGFGWFDHDLTGLKSSHDVGLWTDTGTLLATATVPSGVGGTNIGSFWYTPLGGPISLTAGDTYVIGGTSGLDAYATNVSNFTADPNITFGSMRWEGTGGALQFPTQNAPVYDPGIFGPNMLLKPAGGGAAVPEPGPAMTLAGAGVAGLVFLRRRRKAA